MTFDDPILTVFGLMKWYTKDGKSWHLDLADEDADGSDYCVEVSLHPPQPFRPSISVFPPQKDVRLHRRTEFDGPRENIPNNASVEDILCIVMTRLIEVGIVEPLSWAAQCDEK